MNPKVYIIVLNWNMYKDTVECVESLKKLNYDNYKILIVDNGSTDDSVRMLKERFPDIEMIQNSQNLGFAEGNNIGMRYALDAGADYLFILNNDVTLNKDCVDELVNAAEKSKYVSMLAPKVYYYDYPKTINSLGTSVDWLRLKPCLGFCGQEDHGQFNKIREVDILVGCALLVKKDIVNRIGFMDRRFFLVHEEADWCLRNIKSGFKNIVVPQAMAYHKASKTIKRFFAPATYYNIRNLLYLAHKNASFINKMKAALGLFLLVCKNTAFLIFSPESRNSARAFLFGVIDYFRGNMGKCERSL